MKIPFFLGWTFIYQLFWCELQGYKVLTHCHISESCRHLFGIHHTAVKPSALRVIRQIVGRCKLKRVSKHVSWCHPKQGQQAVQTTGVEDPHLVDMTQLRSFLLIITIATIFLPYNLKLNLPTSCPMTLYLNIFWHASWQINWYQ